MEQHCHVSTRAWKDRLLAGDDKLFAAANHFPPEGQRTTELPASDSGQRKRTVPLELCYGEMEIRRPAHETDSSLPPSLKLRVV
jgi:hypothetical protein